MKLGLPALGDLQAKSRTVRKWMRSDGERVLRVLAADDSAVMREVMRTLFLMHEESGDATLPRMELVGAVRDGVEALEQVHGLRPDVLLLDLEMPRLNGLGVLERLRSEAPLLPVILCSTHTERGARATLDGLAHGAKDYVTKPEHQRNYRAALESLTKQLLPKIAVLAGGSQAGASKRMAGKMTPIPARGSRVDVVAIGVSTGGPSALESLLPLLPRDFGAPVLVVQHMPKLFTGALAERLNRLSQMPVEQARDGVAIRPGKIWLAPGDMHMEIGMGTGGVWGARVEVLRLREGAPVSGGMPSVDLLFRSVAKAYGAGALGVVMTGMGSDGLEGARAMREAGGAVLAQDEASSAVWGMPARVIEEGLASEVVGLRWLAAALRQRVDAGRNRTGKNTCVQDGQREVMHGVL